MSYYRRFIKDFSMIAAPLTRLTRQTREDKGKRQLTREANTPWADGLWTEEHTRAFETLKGAMLCAPVLALPRPNLKWRLATDASNIALGAVLSQIDEKGDEHPIGYYSRKLLPNETKWDIWELELAAVVWATTICRHHLRSVEFELITDSKVVAAVLKKEVPTRRENLVARLFEFKFTITHRKGELNRNADFFSRWTTAYKDWEEKRAIQAFCLDMQTTCSAATLAPSTTTNTHRTTEMFPIEEHEEEDKRLEEELLSFRKRLVEEQRKDLKLRR